MAQRHAELPKIGIRQVRQSAQIDIVRPERVEVFLEAEVIQPGGEIVWHGARHFVPAIPLRIVRALGRLGRLLQTIERMIWSRFRNHKLIFHFGLSKEG